MRIKRRNIQIGDPNALIAKRYDMNVSTNSIPQNPKKSTPKAKKVERKSLVDETEADGEVSKDAWASLSFMKHAAAMIGYWRKGL